MGPIQSRAAVGIVLQELKSRGGFDSWWDDIDEETQQEIVDTLVEKLEEFPL